MLGEGIAADIFAKLAEFLFRGEGVSEVYVTKGDSNDTKIIENVRRIVPAITVSNTSTTASIRVGYQTATFTVAAGGAYTFRWKNPSTAHMCYNDLGNAGVRIEVIG